MPRAPRGSDPRPGGGSASWRASAGTHVVPSRRGGRDQGSIGTTRSSARAPRARRARARSPRARQSNAPGRVAARRAPRVLRLAGDASVSRSASRARRKKPGGKLREKGEEGESSFYAHCGQPPAGCALSARPTHVVSAPNVWLLVLCAPRYESERDSFHRWHGGAHPPSMPWRLAFVGSWRKPEAAKKRLRAV